MQLLGGGGDPGPRRQRRIWRDVCAIAREDQFADWIDHINRRGGGPQDHSSRRTASRRGDWCVDSHAVILRALEEAGCYDALELCNISCLEVLVRHAQLIEYVYAQDHIGRDTVNRKAKAGGRGAADLIDDAAVFGGTHRSGGEAMVAPARWRRTPA